jgi:formylglycine-generating enzyme required for sulfatase activity
MLPAAGALAALDSDDQRWSIFGAKVAQQMVALNPFELASWLDALRPVRGHISKELAARIRGAHMPDTAQMLASSIVADYANDDPVLLAELMLTGSQPFRSLWPAIQRHADKASAEFVAEVAGPANGLPPNDAEKDRVAERQARAAIALVRLGRGEKVWDVLIHRPDPRLRGFIVNWVKPLGVDPITIYHELTRLDNESRTSPAAAMSPVTEILFHPNTSIRRALILALGSYGLDELTEAEHKPLINEMSDLYRNDPDVGIHGTAERALRHWRQEKRIESIDNELRDLKDPGPRRWFVNREGKTFAVINGPVEFRIGSPETDLERLEEPQRQVVIPRRFAIATKEVTVGEFRRFIQADPQFKPANDHEVALKRYSPDAECPWIAPTWYAAAAYCNWLSKQEGLPENEWCYQPNKDGKFEDGMTIPVDSLKRKGYRLPTEAEWEYACRAGTSTRRYYGDSVELLGKYGWYVTNEGERTRPVGRLLPNDLGLFDMLGNVAEWCHSLNSVKLTSNERVLAGDLRVFRGGMYSAVARNLRSPQRDAERPSTMSIWVGFRVAKTCP